jgi:membrane-bound lytic murein transglycosylase A
MPLGAAASQSPLKVSFSPVTFAALEGWEEDAHAEAFAAFLRSCRPVMSAAANAGGTAKTVRASPALLAACRDALSLDASSMTNEQARAFFERRFRPHRVVHEGPGGLLTGYYEPFLEGARRRGGPYQFPILRRPPDLINLVAEQERGALAHSLTHARKTASGHEPYATRREIEEGALSDQGLELLWLKDPVDSFFMHIQGSGRIAFPDGTTVRITYDGKNGHPYTSIGRYLIDEGLFGADAMTLDALKDWLKTDAERGREVMWKNESFVFFRELDDADGPLGVLEIPLTAGRSLAVDTAFHAIGTPMFVSAPTLLHAGDRRGFRRLMIAQDVGSAIRGPERGDLYMGSGAEAGRVAGMTKHPGSFVALLAVEEDGL